MSCRLSLPRTLAFLVILAFRGVSFRPLCSNTAQRPMKFCVCLRVFLSIESKSFPFIIPPHPRKSWRVMRFVINVFLSTLAHAPARLGMMWALESRKIDYSKLLNCKSITKNRCNGLPIQLNQCNTDFGIVLFSNQVIRHWNNLLSEVLNVNTINSFKYRKDSNFLALRVN